MLQNVCCEWLCVLCIVCSLFLCLCLCVFVFIYIVVCVNIRVYGPAICLICTANEFICIIVMQIEDDFCCFLIRLISIWPFCKLCYATEYIHHFRAAADVNLFLPLPSGMRWAQKTSYTPTQNITYEHDESDSNEYAHHTFKQ